MKDLNLGGYRSQEENLAEFWKFAGKFPRKYARIINCVNSTGDELRDCRNTRLAFNAHDMENVKFAYRCLNTTDSMDVLYAETQQAYEHLTGGSMDGLTLNLWLTAIPP